MRRFAAVATLGVLFSLLGHGPVTAAPDDPWDTRFFANGTEPLGVVNVVVASGGNVYVGGSFASMFGVAANNIARWDGSTWSALGSGITGQFSSVNAIAVSGSDVYVGGYFSTAGGSPANYIAKWNGTTWSALGSGTAGQVYALALSGSTLYAGGDFGSAGGNPANRVAQWNGSTWSALGTGMNDTILALTVSGSTLYAGGKFTTAGGSTANRIAQWNGTSWSSLGTGMDSWVTSFTLSGTDLYAGGLFTSAGGVGANRVARWDGATWSALGSGTNSAVFGLAFAGGDLYAVGVFSMAGGTSAPGIARWNGATWASLASGGVAMWNPSGALAGSGTDLWVGGQFVGAGGTAATALARWNGSAWSLASATPGAGMAAADYYPGVRALAYSPSGDLYAGGVFEFAGGTPAVSIAKFDGSTWSALGTGLEGTNLSNYFHGVAQALTFYGGDLIVGGNFTNAGGVSVNHIARWNGSSFATLGSGVGGGQIAVNALIVYNGELYAGGSFSNASSVPNTNGLARWNGTSWSDVGGGTNGSVNTFAILGSDLYVGGQFTTGGGGPGNYVARWNGTSWSALGSGPGSAPSALAFVGSDLYAVGAFPNGSAIVKWDGATWSIPGGGICWFCGFGGHDAVSLAAAGNDLYVGGHFDHVGPGNSIAANGIVKWDGVTWSPLGSGLGGCIGSSCPFPGIGPMLINGTDLYIGGRFTTAGGKPASFLSVWHTCGDGVVEANEQCDDGNTVSGDCCSSTCQYETGGDPCPDDGNPCTNDQCNGSGGCTHPPNANSCDDNLYCNGIDVCSGGTCMHSGNPCPGPDGDGNCSESCDEATDTCTAPDPNGSACNDGLFCNGADSCQGGACTGHTGDPCPGPDGDGNCSESCDEATDSCTAPDPNGSACNDGLFCNGADQCSSGACTVHAGNPCTGGPECAHTCNEAADNCFDAATTACTTDGNVCTDDHCSGAGACIHTNNTAPCNDGLFCNGADTCSGGSCNTHAGNPCTGGPVCAHTCNEAADNCFDPTTTTCTNDNNPCTVDSCDGAGACIHPAGNAGAICRPSAGQCDIAETCTGGSTTCPANGFQPDGTTCNDANACTTGEACSGGVCTGGSVTVCDPCEVCTPGGGCGLPTSPGCQPALARGASVLLRDGGVLAPDKDALKWKWKSSAQVSTNDFGDPANTTNLTVCVIDQGGLKLSATALAGGMCGTRACWTVIPGKKITYANKELTPDGLQKVQAQAGEPGRGKIQAKGKGANLGVPQLGLATPVTVRFLRSDSPGCWEATYSNYLVNTSEMFKAKSD